MHFPFHRTPLQVACPERNGYTFLMERTMTACDGPISSFRDSAPRYKGKLIERLVCIYHRTVSPIERALLQSLGEFSLLPRGHNSLIADGCVDRAGSRDAAGLTRQARGERHLSSTTDGCGITRGCTARRPVEFIAGSTLPAASFTRNLRLRTDSARLLMPLGTPSWSHP